MAVTGETSIEQDQHADIVETLGEIKAEIRSINITTPAVEPPVVNVSVEPTTVLVPPSSVTVQARKPVSYEFTIRRHHDGRIKSVRAVPDGS